MAPPLVANQLPAPPSVIDRFQVLSFELTSALTLEGDLLWVFYPGLNLRELVHDGTSFSERYRAGSSRTAIVGGFRYQFVPDLGWPDGPSPQVWAIQTDLDTVQTSWAYTLNQTMLTGIEATLPMPELGGGAPEGDFGGLESLDYEGLLRLADRVLDRDYLAGIKAGEGYELIRAYSRIWERVSEAVKVTGRGLLQAYAQGPLLSSGIVEFYRTNASAGAVTVKQGTIVRAHGGRLYRTLRDAVFGALDLGPFSAPIRAIFPDYQTNVLPQVITPRGETIPGQINEIVALVEEPPLQDLTIQVRQLLPCTGGQAAMLDLLARANGISRRLGEADDDLRYRTRNLPDNITPAAIERYLDVTLSPYSIRWEFVESYQMDFQTAYDMPDAIPNTNVFTYDDPRPRYFPAVNWWLDWREQWSTFYVNVGECECLTDVGGAYDDLTAVDVPTTRSPRTLGYRAVPAYDLEAEDEAEGLGMAYDGRDYRLDGLLEGVWQQLNSLRAAGIAVGLQQEGY